MTAVEDRTATAAEQARRRLDAAMAEAGLWPQRSPWIREAVARWPRDAFAPGRLWEWDGHAWQGVDHAVDPARWIKALYRGPSSPAVTQLTDNLPTSSLSAPAVVVDMLDSLLLEPGQRVLELGTSACAWNAALLAHRAGAHRVTTLEVDPTLARAGAERLRTAGVQARAVCADGQGGWPVDAPYDRVIATYAVDQVPWAWIEQTRPGGRLVVPWGRMGHVALTVADDHTYASGWMQGLAQFMPDRTRPGRPRRTFADIHARTPLEAEGRSGLDPARLRDPDLLFHLRVALPELDITTADDQDGTSAWLHDGISSWAVLSTFPTGVYVHQGGPRRLADDLTAAWEQWTALGEPEVYDYGMTVTPTAQWVWHDNADTGPRWPTD